MTARPQADPHAEAAPDGRVPVSVRTPPPDPRRGEDRYRVLFDRTPHPAWVVDEQTLRFLAVNDAVVLKYGYAREQLLALTVPDVCADEEAGDLAVRTPASLGDGRVIPWRHRTQAGVVLAADATAHRVRFDGRAAWLVVAGDGADRRRAAATLREREELLRTVIAHIPGGVFWKDRASIYLGCNDQVARDFGLEVPGEVVGRTDYEMAADSAEAESSRACDRQVMETGRPLLHREETRTRADGEQATVLTSRVPLRSASGEAGILGVYFDITERKRLEEQCRQTAKLEAVGRLAGGIAHDFNNLLTVIRGNAELLISAAEDFPEAVRMVDEVRQAADRAAGLVRQLLTFSRPQAANPTVVDLNAVVDELSGILRRLLGGVAVDVDLAPVPAPVLADRGQLEQVVMNLAVNARDAMPNGGRLRLVVSRVEADRPDGPPARVVRLSVTDTGCGMTAEVIARIFDPFFTTKGPDKGTGLGLAVVHGIVQQAGGTITVESEVGSGTTFHIDLPWSAAPPSPSTLRRTEALPQAARPGTGRTVLLVEDEDGIRTLARLTLEGRGYVVTEAPDGAAALEILGTGRAFDLLVTDMMMPGVTGNEVAARAAAARPAIRVVYMSGFVPDDLGVTEPPGALFLPKPFTPADLALTVEKALGAPPPADRPAGAGGES